MVIHWSRDDTKSEYYEDSVKFMNNVMEIVDVEIAKPRKDEI